MPAQNGGRDHLALFVVTAGEGVRQRSEKAKNDGYYFLSHGLQTLAIETVNGCTTASARIGASPIRPR